MNRLGKPGTPIRIENLVLTPEQLWHSVVVKGERVDMPRIKDTLPASLELLGSRLTMWGPTGMHSVELDCSDAHRLHAHWEGFKFAASNHLRGVRA